MLCGHEQDDDCIPQARFDLFILNNDSLGSGLLVVRQLRKRVLIDCQSSGMPPAVQESSANSLCSAVEFDVPTPQADQDVHGGAAVLKTQAQAEVETKR